MKLVVVFATILALSLLYLRKNSYSFDQCQRIAVLQEQVRRLSEVCDSLGVRLDNARSQYQNTMRQLEESPKGRIQVGLSKVTGGWN